MNTTIGCPIPGAIQPNNLVKIIDKACMSYIIDHREEKKGLYLSLENCEVGAAIVKLALPW
jgi:hypothetical protein